MSRVAKKPIALPKGVEINVSADSISVKGPKGTLTIAKPAGIEVEGRRRQRRVLDRRRRADRSWPAPCAPSSPTW